MKAIIFDLDQTLIDRNETFDRYLDSLFARLELSKASISVSDFKARVHQWDDNGYRDKRETFSNVLMELDISELLDPTLEHFYQNYGLSPVVFPGVIEALKKWQSQFPIALMTNGMTDTQLRKLSSAKMDGLFCEVFISERERLKKPQPEFYQRACDVLGITARDCVFVGDHPINDVEAPKRFGMTAIWVKNDTYEAPLESDGTVESVLELPILFPSLR